MQKIQIGKEFRIRINNTRTHRYRVSGLNGTSVSIRCTSGTGIKPPDIIPIYEEDAVEIQFQDSYLMGQSYTFVIDQLEKVVKTYEKPPVEKSVAGLQYFRSEIQKSQESLDQKFGGNCLSFDQSYFTRTIGQIVIQYKLEQKAGDLTRNFNVFSGAGFGAIQAFSCAVGMKTEELNTWYLSNLLDAIKKSWIKKGLEITTSILFNHDHSRLKTGKIEKELKYLFKAKDINGKRTNRDLTAKECKKDVYVPVWDISRRTMTITRKTFPDMPIWLACSAACFDPIFFDTKPLFNGYGVMNGDIVKNNDYYLRMYNPSLNIIDIGSPVRVFDKGQGRIDQRSVMIKKDEERHDVQLDWSRQNVNTRYECTPIDEFFQFATSDNAIKEAQKSGDIEV